MRHVTARVAAIRDHLDDPSDISRWIIQRDE